MDNHSPLSIEELARTAKAYEDQEKTKFGTVLLLKSQLEEQTAKYHEEIKEAEAQLETARKNKISTYETIRRLADEALTGKAQLGKGLFSLDNFRIADHDENTIEEHMHIEVFDVFKDLSGDVSTFTPYQAIVYAEEHGLFLPSSALTGAIIVAAYMDRSNPAAEKVLMQYKDTGRGNGRHVQNTVVDWKGKQIIHYPSLEDFTRAGYTAQKEINKGRERKVIPFSPEDLFDKPLAEALGNDNYIKFIRNIMGSFNVLIEIANYLGKTAKARVPNNPRNADYVAGVFVGSYVNNFVIGTDYDLNFGSAARGVR